jgi:hypothetical protein
MKRRIKLTESDLHKIIKKSVKRILENAYNEDMIAKSAKRGVNETKLKGDFSDLFIPNYELHIPKKTKRKWEDEGRKQDHELDKRQSEYLKQKAYNEKHPEPYKIPNDYFDYEDLPWGK